MTDKVLRVEDLHVHYETDAGIVRAAQGINFALRPGERLGLVGESGSGKSTTVLALLRMIKPPGKIVSGRVVLDDIDLLMRSEVQMRAHRFADIALIPQGAMNSLNPVMRIREQIGDTIKYHDRYFPARRYRERIRQLLDSVGLDPSVADVYPHELSGGMKQRVCIAMGIALEPKVIVADEPTSALDVVVQRQVMQTLGNVQQKINAGLILVGHDMGLMAQFVNTIGVMYAGRLVELRSVEDIFENPRHPYTQMLISSLPSLEGKRVFKGIPGMTPSLLSPPPGCAFHPRCPKVMDHCKEVAPSLEIVAPGEQVSCHLYESAASESGPVVTTPISVSTQPDMESVPADSVLHSEIQSESQNGRESRGESSVGDGGASLVLEARNVGKTYGGGLFGRKQTIALIDASLSINKNKPSITAIAGESGSGKTTFARLLLGMVSPTNGDIYYQGTPLSRMSGAERKRFRREVQAVFQDPFEVYNPFYKVDHALIQPVEKFNPGLSKRAVREVIEEALQAVGLRPEETLGRYPHQLSGGQRQRIMTARALVLRPSVIVADEPVSMVDASLRATILESLLKVHREFRISLIYITHDLTTAYQLCETIMMMYRGMVVESGSVDLVIKDPQHPYTQLLVDSIPLPNPKQQWGQLDFDARPLRDLNGSARGCPFADRCPHVMNICREKIPPSFRTDPRRSVACFLYQDSPVVPPDGAIAVTSAPVDPPQLRRT